MSVYDKNGRMIKSSRKSIKSGIPFKNRGFNLTGHEIQDMEWRIDSGETVDYNGWTFVKDDDFGTIVATSPEGKTYDGFKSLSGFMDLYEYGSIESSRKPIKSSRASLEHAYDTVNMVYKNLLNKPGQMYYKWFIKDGFGQDNAYIMAEHTDYSVRLFFTFEDTGFVYVDGYFTNGSSYDRKTITSWSFENDEYPYDETISHVKEVLDSFFDSGINVLRGEEDVMSSTNRNENSLRAVFGK